MKKFFMIFMVLVLAFSFTGCSEDEDSISSSITLENYTILINTMGAIAEAETAATDENGDVTGTIHYTNSTETATVNGAYTYEAPTYDIYNFTIVFDDYQYTNGVPIHPVTGSIIAISDEHKETGSFEGALTIDDDSIILDFGRSDDSTFYGTFTINGQKYEINAILPYIDNKSSSKFVAKILKK